MEKPRLGFRKSLNRHAVCQSFFFTSPVKELQAQGKADELKVNKQALVLAVYMSLCDLYQPA